MLKKLSSNKLDEIIIPIETSDKGLDNKCYIDLDKSIDDCLDFLKTNSADELYVKDKGKIVGRVSYMRIIKLLMTEMKYYSTILTNVFDSIQEAVCVIDKEARVVLWNKKCEELYGIKKEDIVNKKLAKYFPESINERVLQDGKTVNYSYHSPKEDCHVVISASPIVVEGELIGAISTDRDVDEVQELNKELKEAQDTIKFLRKEVNSINKKKFGNILGKSKEIMKCINISEKVAKFNVPILINGESGTGKEVFAHAIHKESGVKGNFVAVNCSTIPSELFESEFFGYKEGAFTGASKHGKVGYFKLAESGTIFLDEIGDMALPMQAKLLRVLQEKTLKPVGSDEFVDVNFRVISATNRNLEEMVEKGEFREDLYYRLNVIKLDIPALKDREGDIIYFIDHFLEEICKENNISVPGIDSETLKLLVHYDWPGNVRELKNMIQYLVFVSNGRVITKDLLPDYIKEEGGKREAVAGDLDINKNIERLELDLIHRAFELSKGNKSKAAELLNIPRTTLHSKLNKYNID